MSCDLLRTAHALMSRLLHSADLVPVFSFGENDVRLIAHFSPALTPSYTVTTH